MAVFSVEADLYSTGDDPAAVTLEDFDREVQVAIASVHFDRLLALIGEAPRLVDKLDRRSLDLLVEAIDFLNRNDRQVDPATLDRLVAAVSAPERRFTLTRVAIEQATDPAVAARRLLAILDTPFVLRGEASTRRGSEVGSAWWVRTFAANFARLPDADRDGIRKAIGDRIAEGDLETAFLFAQTGLAPQAILMIARQRLLEGDDRTADELMAALQSGLQARSLRTPNDDDVAGGRERAAASSQTAIATIRSEAARRRFGPADAAAILAQTGTDPSTLLTAPSIDRDRTAPFPPAWPADSLEIDLASKSRWKGGLETLHVRRVGVLPSLLAMQFQIDRTLSRAFVFDGRDGSILGDFGLGEFSHNGQPLIGLYGDLIVVHDREAVTAIDAATYKTLWTHYLDSSLAGLWGKMPDGYAASVAMRPLEKIRDGFDDSRRGGANEIVLGCTQTRVIVQGVRRFYALDRRTGQVVWSQTRTPDEAAHVMSHGLLVGQARATQAYSTLGSYRYHRDTDGQPYSLAFEPGEDADVGDGPSAIGLHGIGDRIVAVRTPTGRQLGWSVTAYELTAPTTARASDASSRAPSLLLRRAWIDRASGSRLAAFSRVEPGGRFLRFEGATIRQHDIATGQMRQSKKAVHALGNGSRFDGVTLVRDLDRYYVAFESPGPRRGQADFRYLAIDSDHATVDGTLAAFDAETAELLWQTKAKRSKLLVSEAGGAPFLLCMDLLKQNLSGKSAQLLVLHLYDKRTGGKIGMVRRLITERVGPSRINYRFATQAIDVELSEHVLRITPAE